MRAAAAICLFFFLNVLPLVHAADVKVGDTARNQIAVGGESIWKIFPLPAGEWRIVRVDDTDGRRTEPQHQLRLPRFIDVVLALRDGPELVMLMRIHTLREPTEIRRWSLQDDPCKRTDLPHRNLYDSTVWETKCLTVSQVNGFLTASHGVYADVRTWAEAEGVAVPARALLARFARFGAGQNLTVYVWVKKEPARTRYVEEFVGWSEEYMNRLLEDPKVTEKPAIPVFR